MTKTGLASLFILIAACGKAPEMKVPDESKYAQPLQGKTNTEIASIKYRKISLDCSYRINPGSEIDLKASPTDTFSWDVLNDSTKLRVLNSRFGNVDSAVVVKVSPVSFVDAHSVTDEKQNEYFMEHSPILTASFRIDSKKILSNGQVHDRNRFKGARLSENVETRLFTMTSEDYDGNVITQDLRCTLKTDVNPAYAYQWKKVR